MERVQFQQEQMLAELKDLEQKGLFSKAEIKIIIKKRTAFESALVRRIPKKSDFLRYAEYEMGLETLRRRRVKRLNVQGPPSLSDFALVRGQFHIFERALRKFRQDVALWVQYIELARREGARALVRRISARALQLHPNTPALYVHAAQHEAAPAARALLQRGLRLNSENVDLWAAYVQFELGFVERMRRRWEVLGVHDGDFEDAADAGDDEVVGEEARREIMRGAIVKAVMDEAAKVIPQISLFRALRELLRTYPTPLRDSLVEYLHELLLRTLPADPAAHVMHATRLLPDAGGTDVDVNSVEFIDLLRDANEMLLARARGYPADSSGPYADFVEEWCARPIESNLRLYLVSCLQTVAANASASPRALAAHVRLLSTHVSAEKVARRAAQYTERAGSSVEVWLARLDAEARVGGGGDVRGVWDEARRRVVGKGMEEVWMWGLRAGGGGDANVGDGRRVCEELLRESVGVGAGDLHAELLTHYVTQVLHPTTTVAGDAGRRLRDVRRVMGTYLGTGRFFRAAFRHEAGLDGGSEMVLEALYEGWRRCEGEEVEAALAWGGWLLGDGQGGRAAGVIAGSGGEMRWREGLDAFESREVGTGMVVPRTAHAQMG